MPLLNAPDLRARHRESKRAGPEHRGQHREGEPLGSRERFARRSAAPAVLLRFPGRHKSFRSMVRSGTGRRRVFAKDTDVSFCWSVRSLILHQARTGTEFVCFPPSSSWWMGRSRIRGTAVFGGPGPQIRAARCVVPRPGAGGFRNLRAVTWRITPADGRWRSHRLSMGFEKWTEMGFENVTLLGAEAGVDGRRKCPPLSGDWVPAEG